MFLTNNELYSVELGYISFAMDSTTQESHKDNSIKYQKITKGYSPILKSKKTISNYNLLHLTV